MVPTCRWRCSAPSLRIWTSLSCSWSTRAGRSHRQPSSSRRERLGQGRPGERGGGADPAPPPFSYTVLCGSGGRRVWEELLLAVDLEGGNRALAFRRQQPVDEGLAKFSLDTRMARRIDERHAVLVEEPLVALDDDLERSAVLEARPSGTVRQHV